MGKNGFDNKKKNRKVRCTYSNKIIGNKPVILIDKMYDYIKQNGNIVVDAMSLKIVKVLAIFFAFIGLTIMFINLAYAFEIDNEDIPTFRDSELLVNRSYYNMTLNVSDIFVNEEGDTMTGTLLMDGAYLNIDSPLGGRMATLYTEDTFGYGLGISTGDDEVLSLWGDDNYVRQEFFYAGGVGNQRFRMYWDPDNNRGYGNGILFDGSSGNNFFFGDGAWSNYNDAYVEIRGNMTVFNNTHLGEDVFIRDNLTVDNIFVNELLYNMSDGNGSDYDVFHYNMTEEGDFDENGNFTLNGTWSFEEGIEIHHSTNNITFSTAGRNCISWEQGINDVWICAQSSTLDLVATSVRLLKSLYLQVGNDGVSGAGNEYGLRVMSAGNDDFFYFVPNNQEWGITYPIGFGLRDADSGILFDIANTRQKYNITWNNWNCVILGNCEFAINTIGDIRLQNTWTVNTTTDFCLDEGYCLNDTRDFNYNMSDGSGSGDPQNSWSYARQNDLTISGAGFVDDEWMKKELTAGKNYTFRFNLQGTIGNALDMLDFNVTSDTGNVSYGWQDQGETYEKGGYCNKCGHVETEHAVIEQFNILISGMVYEQSGGFLNISYQETADFGGDAIIYRGSYLEIMEVE